MPSINNFYNSIYPFILIFIEFPKELKKKEKDIARTIINYFKNINVVTKKSEHYSGKYRTPKIEIMGGENRKETIHKENNCRLKGVIVL